MFAMNYKKANFSQWTIYPDWSDEATIDIRYLNTGANGYNVFEQVKVKYTDHIEWKEGPADSVHPLPANYVYYSGGNSSQGIIDPGMTTPIGKEGMSVAEYLNAIYGFFTSKDNFNSSVMKSFDLVITEVKENVSFQVTFMPGTGATGTNKTFTYSDSGALATSDGTATGTVAESGFAKTGHTFAGWATTNGATTAAILTKGALKDALTTIENNGAYTLYAVWTPNQYNITFNDGTKPTGITANVANKPSNGKADYGTNYTIPSTIPTLAGATFQGWNTQANGSGTAYAPGATISNITGSVNLFAQWLKNPTITYNNNGATGGTTPTADSVAPNSTYTIKTGVPTKTGYTFAGWTRVQNSTSGGVFSYNATIAGSQRTLSVTTSDIILYALWNPSITFNANTPAGAKDTVANLPSNVTNHPYGTSYTIPTTPAPTVTGYDFKGWATSTGGSVITSISSVTSATTLYAIWGEKSGYSVVFYDKSTGTADGAAYDTKSGLNWTSNVTLPTAPTKTGYTFGGWFFEKSSTGSGTGTQYSGNPVQGFNSLWLTAKNAGLATSATTTLKLYAQWNEKTRVSVTLNPNGGEYNGKTGVTTHSNILNGGSFTIPTNVTNPIKTGYNFVGWNTKADGTGTNYNPGATLDNLVVNTTLYAKWTGAPVTFTFDKGATTGVTALKGDPYTMSANYGANLAVPSGSTVYTRTGFNFGSWSYTKAAGTATTTTGGNIAVSDFKITWSGNSFDGTLRGVATLTANWTPYTYTVSWNANGGSPTTSSSNLQSTASVTIPAGNSVPTRGGYTFQGWNTAADGSGKAVTTGGIVNQLWDLTGKPSGSTLTAYAQWKERIVEIHFVGHQDQLSMTTANVVYADNNSIVPDTIYVGAATGAIYSSKTASTPTSANISRKVKPGIVNTNYEFSKWMKDNTTTGAVITSGVTSAGVLTVPTNAQGLYEDGVYCLVMAPKSYAYTVEYFLQNVNDSGYTKDTSLTVNSGTAPFGYRVESSTSAGQNDNSRLVTFVRKVLTGFTYSPTATGTKGAINSMSATVANNVIQLYYDRNAFDVKVGYAGSVPTGMTYSPATQNVKYGATVTLTTPTAPNGYIFSGWTVTSGTGITSADLSIPTGGNASFTMPNSALTISGNWTKQKFNVNFINPGSTVGNVTGTTSFTLDFGSSLPSVPDASPKNSSTHYFIGWNVYENCTGANPSTGTKTGLMSKAEIMGTAPGSTKWTVSSNTVFEASWGVLVAVTYNPGALTGGFTQANGAMTAGTVTTAGTFYENLQLGWALPGFGHGDGRDHPSLFDDPNGGRNIGDAATKSPNPKAAPGYKFVGWTWQEETGTVRTAHGHYKNYEFVWESGDVMPTTIAQSYTFTALWEKTTQQVHFSNNCANISGLTGTGATDVAVKTGVEVNLPMSYTASTNPSAYTFLGWTTDRDYTSSSKLYTNVAGHKFTMGAGTRDTALYKDFAEVVADGSYGVTFYPVFQEKTITITYALATGSTGMGSLNRTTETINMASGTPAGSTATAGTGHVFKGWFTDAAHTNPVTASWVTGNTLKPQAVGGVFAAATYYAFFEPEKYTVTFNIGDTTMGGWADGSTSTTKTSPNQIPYNTALGSANVPAVKGQTGYGFVAWTDGAGHTYTDLSNVKITGPITFTATWEPRSGYNIAYVTNGGTPTIPTQSTTTGGAKLKWTDVLNDVMVSQAKNLKNQGYTFDGWYAKSDLSAASKIGTSTTFADGVGLAGMTVSGDDAVTLTLYAKWNAKDFTIAYRPSLPEGTNPTIPNKTPVHWTDTGLLPAGNETLSVDGFDFLGWNTKADGTGMKVESTSVFSSVYQSLYGTTADTTTTVTLYGVWQEKGFTVEFRDNTGKKLTSSTVKWDDQVTYYNYIAAGGPKRLVGWSYTPQGSTAQMWTDPTTKLPVATLAGSGVIADGATFVLTAVIEDNATWTINFNKVNVDGNGNIVSSTVNKVSSVDGYIEPGTAIDITNFNSHNYITEFETPGGTRRADLKGYALDLNAPGTKTSALVTEVTSGADLVFNVYWVEKMFTITYDMGRDGQGATAPSTLVPPSDKQASWTSSNILPAASDMPTWDGHKPNPKWQYKNASGNWVDVPANAKVSDITATDDNTNPIVLRALWETDLARITYATQAGGTAKSTDGTINVPASGSKYEDIDAVNGTPHTMTATANAGYAFVGWYKSDGTLVTNNATLTVTKTGGLFTSDTYEARFRQLGQIQYTIEHYFEDLDGNGYTHRGDLDETRGGQENARITVSADMVKKLKGFTHKTGITGEKLTIASLVDGEKLMLYYIRNAYNVSVVPALTGADAPAPTPGPAYPATGITQAQTTQKYGTALTLPSITAPSGWDFIWTVTYTDSDATAPTTTTLGNGAAFTMPDAEVSIIGTWKRVGHKVSFSAGSDPHGTVTSTGGAIMPFDVAHGKTLGDPSSSGSYANIKVTENSAWALAGWRYTDADGNVLTASPAQVDSIIINADTVFEAIWAQTFYVTYVPGTHGGAGFTTAMPGGSEIDMGDNVNKYPLMIGGVDRTQNAPAAAGYRFVGWAWEANGVHNYWLANAADAGFAGLVGTPATMDFELHSNITFNAIWEALEQDLIYKLEVTAPVSTWTPNGIPGSAGVTGDYMADPKPRTDSTVTLLDSRDIVREGHTLAGWAVLNDDGTTGPTITGTFVMPAHSVTLVPVWEFAQIQIKFDLGNGSENRGTISTTFENITDAFKTQLNGSIATPNMGYAFEGWYMDADCTKKVPGSWVSKLDADGNPLPEGSFRFVGARPTTGWVPAVYYAKFIPAAGEYTIEYYLQQPDGSYKPIAPMKFGDVTTDDWADVTDPTNPAHNHLLDLTSNAYKGYVFNDGAAGAVLRAVVLGDGSTVLKLYYDMIPFKIDYDLGMNADGVAGAWTDAAGPSSAKVGDRVTIPGVTLDGMKLAGWKVTWVDPETGETREAMIGTGTNAAFNMPMADVLAIAQWAQWMPVKIEYIKDNFGVLDKFDEEEIASAATVGDTYTVSTDRINGKRPSGYRNPVGPQSVVIEADADHNIVRVIYTLINDYKITFNPNGGQPGGNQGGLTLLDKPAGFAPNPSKLGYVLTGWNTKADGKGLVMDKNTTYKDLAIALFGEKFDDLKLAEVGLTVYAIWAERTDFEVKYDLNNDKTKNPNILKPVPDWRNPLIIDDVTGVKWSQTGFNKYNDAELDAAPNGYVFVGWNTKADGTGMTITDATKYFDISNSIDPKHEQAFVTLYAMWKEIQIKIEYIAGEGGTIDRVLDNVSAVTGQHVNSGSSAGDRLHSVATPKPGYHFVGWQVYDEKTGKLRVLSEEEMVNQWHTIRNDNNEIVVEEPDADGRLYAAKYIALFEKNADATITYDVNGGEGEIPSTTKTHGLNVNLHNGTGVNRGHYTLTGWNTEADGSGTTYKLGQGMVMPEGGLHLFAMWKINSYGVHVGDRDDDVAEVNGGNTNVEWGQPLSPEFIESIKQTPKPNSTFQGWKYTMTDADTGEVIEGVIWDLSELTVLGPVEIEALYETVPVPEEDVVTEGTVLPKTGDENGFVAILLALTLALAALVTIVLIVLARRRRDDDGDGDDFDGFDDRFARRTRCDYRVACSIPERFSGAYSTTFRGMRNACCVACNVHNAGDIARIAAPFSTISFKSEGKHKGLFLFEHPFCRVETLRNLRIRSFIVVALATCALACTMAFAPGVALAAAGDPGSGSTPTKTQSISSSNNTQSHHSNVDPATTSTGSFQSKGAKSASISTCSSPSASKSASTASSTTSSSSKSASRASSAPSAASARSSAATASSCSGTVSASNDEIARLTYRNTLAHKTSSYTASSRTMTSAVSAAPSSPARDSATASSALSETSASTAGTVPVGGNASTAGAASATTTSFASVSAAASTTASSKLTGAFLSDQDTLSGISASFLAVFATKSNLGDKNAPISGTNCPEPGDFGCLAAENPRSRFFESESFVPQARFSCNFLSNRCETADLPLFLPMTAIVSSDADPSECFFADFTSAANISDLKFEAQDKSADKTVEIVYKAGEGGTVSHKSDTICSSTGTKPDESGSPTDEDATGAVAIPGIGYHFAGWVLDLSEFDPDFEGPIVVTDKLLLDADTIKAFSYSQSADLYMPAQFVSNFTRNNYTLNYHINGGSLDSTISSLEPTVTTFGKDDILSTVAKPTKEGYEFIGWNTEASGLGVAIKDGETLTTNKLRAMVLETPGEDGDGAAITLFAQWSEKNKAPVVLDPDDPVEPIDPVQPVTPLKPQPPVTVPTEEAGSGIGSSTARSEAGYQRVMQPVGTGAALDAENAAPSADPLMTALESLFGIGRVLDLPPALEVLPAAAEEFTTVGAEALLKAQESTAVEGFSAAGATQVAATAATAAGVIAVMAGAASAISTTAARRRVERAFRNDQSIG